MNNRKYQAKRIILSNKHLKEWNDNLKRESEALYILRSKHTLERDRLLYVKTAGNDDRASLAAKHLKELEDLEITNSEIRQAIQKRHHQEKNQL